MTILRTARLFLVPATAELLEAELTSRATLGAVLGGEVPESWPPELYDADAVRWTIDWLASHPEDAAWSLYYILESRSPSVLHPRLVGIAGYKGAPDEEGAVEIGYGVVTEARRRGYATEAVRELLARAFAGERVRTVIAQTLPELAPSIGVLVGTGFVYDGLGSDLHEPTAIRYVLPRKRYAELVAAGPRYPTGDSSHLTRSFPT
jgi:RimJ/RimL family protein N-acetyltransferase